MSISPNRRVELGRLPKADLGQISELDCEKTKNRIQHGGTVIDISSMAIYRPVEKETLTSIGS